MNLAHSVGWHLQWLGLSTVVVLVAAVSFTAGLLVFAWRKSR